jgi:ABC-type transport system involved in multi-copper enzyme maturation permease subunit
VTAAFAAEWLKLRKRPAVWVLGIVQLALVVLLDYAVLFLILLTRPSTVSFGPGQTAESLRQILYPEHFVTNVLNNFSGGFGGAISLILGVLVVGSEYGWGTLATVFTQRPGRVETFAGKVAALAAVLAVFDALVVTGGAVAAALIGAYYGHLTPWPSVGDLVKGLLAAWLLMGLWAGLGVLLSVLFRQSALAIGLGLVYAIAVEGIVFGLLGQFSWVRNVEKVFPGANGTALVDSFGSVGRAPNAPGPVVGPGQAVLVLLAYLVAFVLLSLLLLRRRDVT